VKHLSSNFDIRTGDDNHGGVVAPRPHHRRNHLPDQEAEDKAALGRGRGRTAALPTTSAVKFGLAGSLPNLVNPSFLVQMVNLWLIYTSDVRSRFHNKIF
jgi:hypothetical protein